MLNLKTEIWLRFKAPYSSSVPAPFDQNVTLSLEGVLCTAIEAPIGEIKDNIVFSLGRELQDVIQLGQHHSVP